MASFDGKVVLVTGGSSGIGRAAVRTLAEAGARVVLAARRVKPGEDLASDIRGRGGLAHFVTADISQTADVQRMIAEAIHAFGRIDAAFNNAATTDGAFALTADSMSPSSILPYSSISRACGCA
jgi:NAD(P)-dependent dehydrogenase (short-subunit alcohol dehydrogenase family)